MDNSTWNPEIAGQQVRLKDDPGKQGETTGKVRPSGSRIMVQVAFGPAEKVYKNQRLLELCEETKDIAQLLLEGRFGGPEDIRRILTLEKIKGQLTNIFYSMETSHTDFYAHQFKPILKFLNSTNGRLLIADEVGLGKTIESMYVWKELQVREEARRLLIVCPAMLRQKWQDDLRQRFNIMADIIDTKELVQKLEGCLQMQGTQPFVCITGLEGIRQGLGVNADWENTENTMPSARLARLLFEHPVDEGFNLLDLVIIDEAHYLRNAETAGHKLGKLLRDAAKHLLLLTATPIQTHSKNLYNLLRLLDQDNFPDQQVFESMMDSNRPIVKALRHLWSTPHNIELARQEVLSASQSSFFRGNLLLQKVQTQLSEKSLSEDDIIELGYKLEKLSLLGQYISRSRKRDVLLNRVKRKAQTLNVCFSPLEKNVYDNITETIRKKCKGQRGTALFTLITRQRQMASCMVAALETWQEKGVLDELTETDEFLWEDFGLDSQSIEDVSSPKLDMSTIQISDRDLKALRKSDSKYKALVKFLKPSLAENPAEKFVIFAYFRATLHYLQRRLQEDGIEVASIMGNMGDEKEEIVKRFRESDGPSVLLSSEVGSEGIDLQHCRFVVNYDLPWNPMRVEQRIGRIDRLGQEADSISIINFSLSGTIEERVLDRLYERINIFEESIGDLEDILGAMTEKLVVELFQQDLTEQEQEERMQQTAAAILKQRQMTDELESEAVNMLAFSDHILNAIEDSRTQGRWLQPDELKGFVSDYFNRYYPGSSIRDHEYTTSLFDISLSDRARKDFRVFLHQHASATTTRLYATQVSCFFDPKATDTIGKGHELIDPTHPLIQWIRTRCESGEQPLYPLAAIHLETGIAALPADMYVFTAQRWTFTGLKTESKIAYRLARCSDGDIFSSRTSEQTVVKAIQFGVAQPNAANAVEDLKQVLACVEQCEQSLEHAFDEKVEEFGIENESRCEVQRRSAIALADRKRTELEAQIERIKASGDASKARILPALEGKLKKIEDNLHLQNELVNQKSEPSFDQNTLAVGLLFVR